MFFKNCDLKRFDNNIILKTDSDSKKIASEVVQDIHLFGEISLNTKLLNFISQKGILLHTYNYYGFYSGTFMPKETNISGKLLVNQVLFYDNHDKRMEIAKEFIKSAVL